MWRVTQYCHNKKVDVYYFISIDFSQNVIFSHFTIGNIILYETRNDTNSFRFFFFLSFSNEVSVELYSMFVLRGTIIRVHIDVPKILTLIPKNVKHFSQLEHRGI